MLYRLHSSFFILHSPFSGSRRGFTLIELLVGMTIASLIIGATYVAYLAAHDSWVRCGVYKEQHQLARAALSFMERHLRAALPPDESAGVVFEGDNGSSGLEDLFLEPAGAGPETETLAPSASSFSSPSSISSTQSPESTRQQSDSLRFVSVGGRASAGPRLRSDLCEIEFYLEQPILSEEELAEGASMTVEAAEDGAEIALSSLMVRRRNLPTGGSVEGIEEAEEEELVPNVASFNVAYFDGFEWVEEWLYEDSLPVAVEITLAQGDPNEPAHTVTFSKLIMINTVRD